MEAVGVLLRVEVFIVLPQRISAHQPLIDLASIDMENPISLIYVLHTLPTPLIGVLHTLPMSLVHVLHILHTHSAQSSILPATTCRSSANSRRPTPHLLCSDS